MPSTSLSEAPSSDESALITTSGQNSSALNKDLSALRAATTPFHNFEKALEAGYDVEVTPCLEDPMLGGQGFHYGNLGLFDGNVELRRPETLLYEPHGGGSMRPVA